MHNIRTSFKLNLVNYNSIFNHILNDSNDLIKNYNDKKNNSLSIGVTGNVLKIL